MITVVMTTYAPSGDGIKRAEYAEMSLLSYFMYMRSPESLRLHIADDGSPDNSFISRLCELAKDHWSTESSFSTAQRGGIGASLNLAMNYVDDLWLYTTDDWMLTGRLNLWQAIRLIRRQEYDLVRLAPIHPNLVCCTRFNTDIGWWWEIKHTYGGYAFATRPFLATKLFYNKVGPFLEKANAYEVERIYSEQVCKQAALRIALTGEVTPAGPWEHIGEFEVGKYEVGQI